MGDIVVREVPDAELEALEERGRRHGRSREAELRQMIHDAAREERALMDLARATEAIDARLDTVERALPEGPSPHRRRYGRSKPIQPTPRSAAERAGED